jgi:hypothetical protein
MSGLNGIGLVILARHQTTRMRKNIRLPQLLLLLPHILL